MTDKLVCPVCSKAPKITYDAYDGEFQLHCDKQEVTHIIIICAKTEEEAKQAWLKAFGKKERSADEQ